MRIDAHQHVWDLARGDYDWLTPDLGPLYRDFELADLKPLMDSAGISASILVQAAATEAETRYLLDLAEHHDWILGVVGWIDVGATDASARLAALARHPKFVGLRPMLQDMGERDWILRDEVAPSLAALVEHGLVLDALIRPDQIGVIAAVADRYPELVIVIDHAAKPTIGNDLESWSLAMRLAGRRPNIRVKLSGLLTEAPMGAGVDALRPVVTLLLDAFGPERLLWGSDWPVLNMASDYARWLDITDDLLADLASDERMAVLGGNAASTYGRPE